MTTATGDTPSAFRYRLPGADGRPLPRAPWIPGRPGLRYGGDYNPEQWPREVWAEDVALMREAGVDLVSVGIFSWALLEPQEGRYDFGFLDELLDLLHGAGIDVDLATPTTVPPAWFWKAYPDSHPVTREGVTLGRGSRGMVSPSSPEYRAAAVAVTEQLAQRYAAHPAVVLWHVHNEYGAPVSEDYSDYSVAAFRAWLQAKYATLGALNAAWGTLFWGQVYGEWDEIDAPRVAATVVNQTQRLDFARFTSDALLACFTAERDAIKRYSDKPVTTNFMATNCPSIDYWRWSSEVDLVSNDHYLAAERHDNHVLLAMDADLTRSFAGGRPWILMEHSTSAVNWQPRNIAKRPGELARNAASHLARGADAVLFFQFRASRYGAEKFHSAMLPHAGARTRVWKEVVEFGADLDRLSAVLGSVVRTRVAILWDIESFWAHDLEWRPSVELDHRERIEAFYSALWKRGVTVDFAHPHSDLSGYGLVLAPSLYLMDRTSSSNVTEYVRAGGTFAASYFSGIVDENDAVHEGGFPGALREVLGLSIPEFLPLRDGEVVELDSGARGSGWTDDIALEGAVERARYATGPAAGGPAITRNVLGDGSAWYLSTRLRGDDLADFVDTLLTDAGITPPAETVEGLEVVVRHGDVADFTFLINHAETDAAVASPGTLELITGSTVDGTVVVPGKGVRVVRRDH
ncbi:MULTISPECIES: beta-galactosidase [unclassified Rathayibacter]|uniref:beta-galactosidase n=1 Tax=unclassified Rathayibacter TaxID=2609250 RepID=UPI000CE87F98|nr:MULTISPECIES: beta-galactosidase [unclassified Rathayibacter]PPH05806.1 beta-galactosidase [Rathayibacter sp. AY1F6]PPH19183.1 beta-galactosidase [Rathayibacter sp. AY1F8]PPH21433.1 beta-galactosidase [Rathayibacter sp. AY1C4]PPH72246.1 beta-galactosidase [Rathayibacter sp. AY1D4]